MPEPNNFDLEELRRVVHGDVAKAKAEREEQKPTFGEMLLTTIGTLLGLVLAAVVFVTFVLLRGVTLLLMWRWFVTPVFQVTSPPLLYCVSLSLMLTYAIWKMPLKAAKDDDAEGTGWQILRATVYLCIWLGLAFGLHLLIEWPWLMSLLP